MQETADDLGELQRLLDESRANAGAHLRSIFTDELSLTAAQLSELLQGMQVLDLATVTANGEPRVAPVDGHFHRGHFYFGSSPESARFRHLRARPAVSAALTRGEELAVIVHGTAHELDTAAPEHEGLRRQLIEFYGEGWADWGSGSPYARIDAKRMFTRKA
jgi:nitroimidazol reductase NimA-like FMN-containing flavoprotein (pyridoxamine 5'-phosphate oxidase superfamily)